MGWNYLSIPKLQRLFRWSLGMDKWFHPTLYLVCDYLSMLGLKLIHVSKSGPRWSSQLQLITINWLMHYEIQWLWCEHMKIDIWLIRYQILFTSILKAGCVRNVCVASLQHNLYCHWFISSRGIQNCEVYCGQQGWFIAAVITCNVLNGPLPAVYWCRVNGNGDFMGINTFKCISFDVLQPNAFAIFHSVICD